MKHIRWIWRFWQPHRPWLYVLGFLTLLSSAATIGFPLVLKFVIDNLDENLKDNPSLDSTELTYKLVMMIVIVGLVRSASWIYPGVRAQVNNLLEKDVREYYFGQIVQKGYRFFQKFRTGDLVTRLSDDIFGFPKIAWFCCSGIFRAVESSSKFVFCMAFMFYMNWQLALLAIIPLPVMLMIFYRIRMALTKASADRQQSFSRTNDELEASFSGIRILKAFCGEMHQVRNLRGILDERIAVELRLQRLWMGVRMLYQGVQFTGQIIVIVAGGYMVLNDQLKIGEFYAFYVYLSILLAPLMDIPNLFVTSRQAFACIDREIEIEETRGGTEDIYTGRDAVGRIERLALERASFCFDPGLPNAVDNVDLELGSGRKIAIVGRVGSGKSTLLKVVAGLLPPQEGALLVNGRPLTEYELDDYRRHVGYIPQEATLFSESVSDNVSFGRETDAEIVIRSLEMARVRTELEALPKGLETILGQKGLTISGGQKQRLAIARALAGQPDVLLMDDCTASLDAENEKAFWELLREHYPQTACLIVTHRLATAQVADLIHVMEDGRIVGSGSHMQLLAECEAYRNFLSREEMKADLELAGNEAG
ncbi:ABC transporter ATP-binding protein [bacterium]|nr:ABC transporter ATP-binding protein [bacterium]